MLIAEFYTTRRNGYDWDRFFSSTAKLDSFLDMNDDLSQPSKVLAESLIQYDELFKSSKESLIRILNDASKQHHGIPLVAAWASESEVLLDYFINYVKNSNLVACLVGRKQLEHLIIHMFVIDTGELIAFLWRIVLTDQRNKRKL